MCRRSTSLSDTVSVNSVFSSTLVAEHCLTSGRQTFAGVTNASTLEVTLVVRAAAVVLAGKEL